MKPTKLISKKQRCKPNVLHSLTMVSDFEVISMKITNTIRNKLGRPLYSLRTGYTGTRWLVVTLGHPVLIKAHVD